MNDFTTTFTVDASPDEAFAAINDVRGWWTGNIEGDTRALGDVFTYRHLPEHRSVQRITESAPGKRVVWHIDDAELTFVDDRDEWIGTDVTFDISERDGRTEVRFSHLGLTPGVECYEACSNAWGFYVNGGLRKLIETASG
ncbi:MAG TPA: SRPBCC domain-containing protein [Pseudolysinimonas sp.]|nr:SRPBCC domain-containing protein [Pseudolysinimonas sp.]